MILDQMSSPPPQNRMGVVFSYLMLSVRCLAVLSDTAKQHLLRSADLSFRLKF